MKSFQLSAARTIIGGVSSCGVSEIVACSAPCIFLLFSWDLQFRSSFTGRSVPLLSWKPLHVRRSHLGRPLRPGGATPPGEVRQWVGRTCLPLLFFFQGSVTRCSVRHNTPTLLLALSQAAFAFIVFAETHAGIGQRNDARISQGPGTSFPSSVILPTPDSASLEPGNVTNNGCHETMVPGTSDELA